ncbi:hypothetical protein PMAYCL1PPCAC_04520 [Pristionchus mayeri]|uniref:Uncharacterized protein n=1 Tax=Pristionchus mayeri TaxID=1317129 RepID=A0AAN5C870_9BILA|nr:hypothetical protein PMAYCL1PPCAC_04520 [Pristionchus mayeri]
MLSLPFLTFAAFACAEQVTIEGRVLCPDAIPLVGVDVYLTQPLIGINNNKIVATVTTDEKGRFSITGDACQGQSFSVFTGFRCDSNNASRVISQCPTYFKGHPTGLFIGERNCATFKNGPQWAYIKMDVPGYDNDDSDGEERTMRADIVLNPSDMRIGRRFYSNQ